MAKKTQRYKDLAKIHLAKKQLQIDDDIYRNILWTVARVRSAKDLDMHGRMKLIQHFKSLGWSARVGGFPGRPHNIAGDDQLKKIEALLADMKLPWSYVNGIMKQMNIPVKKIEFLNSEQKRDVIVALTKKQKKLRTDNAST